MNPTVRNVLAVVGGIIIGALVNTAIVTISGSIAPLPAGVDPNDMESIKANIGNYSTASLALPILAHAVGTLVAAFVAAKFAVSANKTLALGVGVFFLLMGAIMVYLIPEAPLWMKVSDLILAYIPMAWLGWKLSGSKK